MNQLKEKVSIPFPAEHGLKNEAVQPVGALPRRRHMRGTKLVYPKLTDELVSNFAGAALQWLKSHNHVCPVCKKAFVGLSRRVSVKIYDIDGSDKDSIETRVCSLICADALWESFLKGLIIDEDIK